MRDQNNFQQRTWLNQLGQIYFPKRFPSQGSVLLLDGHVNDQFFWNVKTGTLPLHRLLYEYYRDQVDAFVWYGYPTDENGAPMISRSTQMHLTYEFCPIPIPQPGLSVPYQDANTFEDPLGAIQLDLNDVAQKFRNEIQGQSCFRRDPLAAIQEIQELLLSLPEGRRAVVVFGDVFWRIDNNQILSILRKWPEICQTRHHLIVFALSSDRLSWIDTCFDRAQKGVSRLLVDGPTTDEVKAFMIQQALLNKQDYFDWRILDKLVTQLAERCESPEKGLKWLVREYIPNIIQTNHTFLGKDWYKKYILK